MKLKTGAGLAFEKYFVHPLVNVQLRKVLDFDLNGKTVLDVGSSYGNVAKILQRKGAEVWGIEPDKSAVFYASRSASASRFVVGDGTELPFADIRSRQTSPS